MFVLAHRLHRTAACWLVLLLAAGAQAQVRIPEMDSGAGPGIPTIAIDPSVVVGAVNDATNPTALVTVSDPDDPVEDLVVTVESTNGNVLPAANVTVQGSGEERIVLFEPVGRGTSSVTFTVMDPAENAAAVTMTYASSVLAPDPSGRYHHHISDASAALDVGDGLMLLVNDETNTFFLHRQTESGPPVKTWTFTEGELGTDEEIDFESIARSGELLVLSGSHGNNRSGSARPERRTFVGATITGTGAGTELAFLGRYNGLWADLRTWDAEDGHGLGADFLGFVAGTAPGVDPDPPNGFNIEALELAPDDATLYLGFRAPTVEIEGTFHALIVPVLNVDDIVDGVPAPGPALFGAPIFLDLGGRSIRALRRNEHDEYLISAGPSPQNDTWALYVWDGESGHDAQFNQLLPNPNPFTGGTWESIANVPHPPTLGAEVRMVTDSGDTDFYGTGPTKDLPTLFQKSYSQLFVLDGAAHDLIVSLEGSGEGTVSGDGITCPGDCGETYPEGAEVTLTATPESGFVFTGWGGDCAGTDDCLLTLDADKAVTATFVATASLAFEPSSLEFGDVDVGETAGPLTATLANSGSLEATGVAFNLPDSPFTVDTGACGAVLSSGGSCDVSVTFAPTVAGAASASLAVTADGGAAAALPLAGSGVGDATFTPMALDVDLDGPVSDRNGVFEPDELIEVMPSWRNDGNLSASLTGTVSDFTGPDGAVYSLGDTGADYGLVESGVTARCDTTGICYSLELDDPAVRPAPHWEAAVTETLDDAEATARTWALHIGDSFTDVPRESLFYHAIETLLHSGVTGGCSDSEYCPQGVNTRSQMAVFLLKAVEDGDYVPPACEEGEERFLDVPADNLFCSWIEELAAREITTGCGGDNYCPGDSVTRAQMAVFLLKAALGSGYAPPACTGEFVDVPCSSIFASWIEDLAERGITGGCGGDNYCPADAVTRAQMAAFVTKAFGLTLYGP